MSNDRSDNARLSRRDFLRSSAAALSSVTLGLGGPAWGESAVSAKRPNILFIFADDHAYQAIGAYGSRINKTPNIDRIAKEGMLFRNCTVTNSICAPSRAVILTGKHSHLNGVINNGVAFDGSQQTFPKLLRAAGYQTALIGKWHLKSEPTGFDYYCRLLGQGPYYSPNMRENGKDVQFPGYTTDVITDKTLEWLERRDKTKPFMAMCQHKAPHRNWMPSPKRLTLYDDVEIPEPETLFDDYADRSSAAKGQKMTIANDMSDVGDLKITPPGDSKAVTGRLTEEERKLWEAAYDPKNDAYRKINPQGKDKVRWRYQRYIKDYLRCIASIDDNVGRLLDYLDEKGLADDTVVIYSSDQGFYLGEHGWYDKRWMYKESFGTPLIVRWPGVAKPGSENADLAQNLDFAETFLEIAGVPVPDDMQGASLVPLLKGETPANWRKSVYYHYYEFPGVHNVQRHCGVATHRHKLIHYYRIGEWELFDLEKDPNEMRSVYSDPAYADVVKEMKAELERLRKLYEVPEQDPDARPVAETDKKTAS
ncbi:MAG TPA: sulfatase/phosphatase domain-containing protein [Sumerlaeia bacterium]|nr:sulfatase/phosphatase domain-containing protein [Sumerlaeia bacterium]